MKYSFTFLFLFVCFFSLKAQNLPSLWLDRNINATFSILAFDPDKEEWGIAVATNNLYVGNSTIYIDPGLGAFSVIAETEPDYAMEGFKQLKAGKTIEEAIIFTKEKDDDAHYRQVSGIDAQGNTFAFTGEALPYWKGRSAHYSGKNYVVMGNQLGDSVLIQMARTFENSRGSLAQRLLESLRAGEESGGQVNGKQSAALVVKGTKNQWYNQIDLRVDHSKQPFQDLQRLLNYHYGRIRLNQARYALDNDNPERAKRLLAQAREMIQGWYSMYPRLAVIYSRMSQDAEAIKIIQEALRNSPRWKEYLSAFHYLREHPEMQNLIQPEKFEIKDWQAALQMLLNLKKISEASRLGQDLVKKYPESSYLYYLLGKAYADSGEIEKAVEALQKSLELDANNREARVFLNGLK
ncbi:MAG: DUF1028 domain-containing protein [Bacteroidota bacterium]